MTDTARGRLRRLAGLVPGVRTAREVLVESVGSWLYHGPTLAWLSDRDLARQLPRSYRAFARYCAAQGDDPIGAELLLRGVIALSRLQRQASGTVALRVADDTICLDLRDPRFLRVPGELADARAVLCCWLRPGDTFVDAGANHGSFSVAASTLVGHDGLVVALEPQPRLAGLVQRSLASGPARFQVHATACGDRSADVELHVPRATSGAAGVFAAYSAAPVHRTTTVPLRRLDDLLHPRSCTERVFVKLDVEGSELALLRGAARLLREASPALLVEINPRAMSAAGTSPEALRRLLLDAGYDRLAIPSGPRQRLPLADVPFDATQGDVVVLHERGAWT